MGTDPIFDPKVWSAVPFHFWTAVFFVFGAMVGSFLNVCIHRLPRGESLISPPSHCPHCQRRIPWFRNIPILTWAWQRGRCAECAAPIHPRYVVVEVVTGIAFAGCWLRFGDTSAVLAAAHCLILAGFITATFIDWEHFIIPDEITLGGAVAGFFCSLAVPGLHGVDRISASVLDSLLGIAVGAGVVYAILRLGKLMFGRQPIDLPDESRVRFTETSLILPDREMPYEDLFYRPSDTIFLEARTGRLRLRDLTGPLPEETLERASIQLSPNRLQIDDRTFNPEEVAELEVVTNQIILPREAMGLGDVKFMAAIGAFLGWGAALFSLMFSAIIGSAVGISLVLLKKQEWSSRLPYGPYIAMAATLWIFGGKDLTHWWLNR